MGGIEAVTVVASVVALLGGIAGIFAALIGYLLDEE